MEHPPPAMASILADSAVFAFIVKRLSPVDLVRAALTCRRWRRAFALAIPRAPPLIGYLCQPESARTPQHLAPAELPAIFVPRDASSPHLNIRFTPEDSRNLQIQDAHLGLVLLLPRELPEMHLLRILVLDPASGRRALLPPPPRDVLPEEQWRQTRRFLCAAVLSRSHPSKLRFEAVCVTLDDEGARAWIAYFDGGTCLWRALDHSPHPTDFFDPSSITKPCIRVGGTFTWRCNSGSLLTLEHSTLEIRMVAARDKLGDQYQYPTCEAPDDGWQYACLVKDIHLQVIAPYHLPWPPAFLSLPEEGGSWVQNVMLMVRVAIYNTCYLRRLFPNEFFVDLSSKRSDVRVRTLVPSDTESQSLVDWVEKGVCDALEKKFLRTILFCICDEDGLLIEAYRLEFTYGQEIVIELHLPGFADSIWTFKLDAAENDPNHIWNSTITMVEKLVSHTNSYQQIPKERVISVKLLYYDDLTPLSYEPPFFRSYYDSTSNLFQDISGGSTCSDKAQGHLFCISKDKTTFYFDSGASRHICHEKKIFQGLNRVAKQHWVNITTAENKTVCLDSAGSVKCDGIELSPVYFYKDGKRNVISIGQLDDGNNLIFLGDRQVHVMDTKTSSVIGEGALHERKNRYRATSIRSIKALTPGNKKMRSVEADATEPKPSMAVEDLKEPPTEAEKKFSWVLDCFCENHLTCNADLLIDMRQASQTFVTATGTFEATGVGKVKSNNITLSDVYYCPDISVNFISEGQLDREGYIFTRFKHKCTIQWRKTKKIVGVAYMDKKFVYNVYYFHPHYSKRLAAFESAGSSSKHPRRDRESSSA